MVLHLLCWEYSKSEEALFKWLATVQVKPSWSDFCPMATITKEISQGSLCWLPHVGSSSCAATGMSFIFIVSLTWFCDLVGSFERITNSPKRQYPSWPVNLMLSCVSDSFPIPLCLFTRVYATSADTSVGFSLYILLLLTNENLVVNTHSTQYV